MPRLSSVVVPIIVWVVAGVVLPIAVLAWLLAHHQPPYALDRAAMETPRSALGGHPVSIRPVSGVLDVIADGGSTAVYADGGSATIVRTSRPSQVIGKYGSSLRENRVMSFSAASYTQRDSTLMDGRVARTFGMENTVFAFVAPSAASLDRLVAQSAVRPNAKRDVGNTVLDDHRWTAVGVGLGWFVVASLIVTLAIVRAFASGTPQPSTVTWPDR
jgi:hypothetical protein